MMGGVLTLGAILVLTLAVGGFQGVRISAKNKQLKERMVQMNKAESENKKAFTSIEFYKDNKEKIDRAWNSIKDTIAGPQRVEELDPFQEIGMAKIKTSFNEVLKEPGFEIGGDTAEFQRIEKAISELEKRYPLIQFTKIKLNLPEKTPPMSKVPTYLSLDAEIVMPALPK